LVASAKLLEVELGCGTQYLSIISLMPYHYTAKPLCFCLACGYYCL